jgi:hypothetical protein
MNTLGVYCSHGRRRHIVYQVCGLTVTIVLWYHFIRFVTVCVCDVVRNNSSSMFVLAVYARVTLVLSVWLAPQFPFSWLFYFTMFNFLRRLTVSRPDLRRSLAFASLLLVFFSHNIVSPSSLTMSQHLVFIVQAFTITPTTLSSWRRKEDCHDHKVRGDKTNLCSMQCSVVCLLCGCVTHVLPMSFTSTANCSCVCHVFPSYLFLFTATMPACC